MQLEEAIESKLKTIFGMKAVLRIEGETEEQETIFVEVTESRTGIRSGKEHMKVTAKCTVYGQSEKMPVGYFYRRIAVAPPLDTKDFFFYDFEESERTRGNIVKRSFSFVYFFSSDFNPAPGNIESLEIE